MLRKISIALIAMLFLVKGLQAQQPCATDIKYWELVKAHPELLEYEKMYEEQLKAGLSSGALGKTTLSASDTTMYDVPIVIHVVHDYGVENLRDDDLYEAAKYWAIVYLAQNSDTSSVIPIFKKWIGNSRIRLHLATIDPNGKPTKGIVRHNSYLTTNGDDGAKFQPWPNNKYINIWFIRTFGASATGAAAYAYNPMSASFQPQYDGVISLASYANYGKTIPHELGHVLNLRHVWGNNNNAGVSCTGSDLVDDTPPTKGHNPVGCVTSALYDTTCVGAYLVHYTGAGGADSVVDYPDTVNAQNIMDYTYCDRMFTLGQCFRMRSTLNNATAGRNNLITAANLAATGALAPMPDLPPVADYIVERATGGSGFVSDIRTYFLAFTNNNGFSFRNASWNDTISGIKWLFSNGASVPVSTSTTSVLTRFSQPGWVTVTQIATSNAGSDTLINTHAVYAADTTATPALNYVQDFDSANCANWPMFNFYNNAYKWEFYNGVSWGTDGKCIRYRSYESPATSTGWALGDHDDFYTPAFNLAGITGNYYINFHSAGASKSGTGVSDSLEIDASTTGGTQWTRIAGISGSNIANNGVKSGEFVPTSAAQWKARAINIPDAYRTPNTYFRFRYWPGEIGNDFYMDNFYLYPYPTEILEASTEAGTFKLYPNPTNSACNLLFRTGNSGTATILVKDITGRVVYNTSNTYQSNTVSQETIGRDITQAAGIYFVTVIVDGSSKTEKLVVY